MKNIIFTVAFFTCLLSYSQNGAAYKQLKPIDNSGIINALQKNAEISARNRQLADQRRQRTQGSFNKSRENGIKAYKGKNYTQCIYFYESSKKLGWYDASFEYVAGLSYFALWKEIGKKKYKSKAKKLLKLSKKHGYIDAELFLDKNF